MLNLDIEIKGTITQHARSLTDITAYKKVEFKKNNKGVEKKIKSGEKTDFIGPYFDFLLICCIPTCQ